MLVTRLREKGMSWDSRGWFFGATGEAVRKFDGALLGDAAAAGERDAGGKEAGEREAAERAAGGTGGRGRPGTN